MIIHDYPSSLGGIYFFQPQTPRFHRPTVCPRPSPLPPVPVGHRQSWSRQSRQRAEAGPTRSGRGSTGYPAWEGKPWDAIGNLGEMGKYSHMSPVSDDSLWEVGKCCHVFELLARIHWKSLEFTETAWIYGYLMIFFPQCPVSTSRII